MAEPTSTPVRLRSESSFSSLNEDFEIKSNEEIANELATDFSKFFNFNVAKEEIKFNDSVEMMLTKLDEFFSMVDMIRSDTSLCLSTTLPDIQTKCAEMEVIFEKIDKLEEFVDVVKECVAATEDKIAKAESDLGTVGGLVKKITSLVSKKKPLTQSNSRGKKNDFVPANIFSTEEFFVHSNSEQFAASASPHDTADVLSFPLKSDCICLRDKEQSFCNKSNLENECTGISQVQEQDLSQNATSTIQSAYAKKKKRRCHHKTK